VQLQQLLEVVGVEPLDGVCNGVLESDGMFDEFIPRRGPCLARRHQRRLLGRHQVEAKRGAEELVAVDALGACLRSDVLFDEEAETVVRDVAIGGGGWSCEDGGAVNARVPSG